MAKVGFLSKSDVQNHIVNVKKFLKNEGLDAFFFSSADIFLNEYVPIEECLRYYITGFTGSTGIALVLKTGKVQLFVDGRYFEQADLEVDLNNVEVNKIDINLGLKNALFLKLKELKIKELGVSADRLDLSLFQDFQKISKVTPYYQGEMQKLLNTPPLIFNKEIKEIDLSYTGETTASKLKRIVKENEVWFVSSLDSIAWLTNLRRYELPNQSTFRAKALATRERVYLLLEEFEGEVNNPNVEVYLGSFSNLETFLSDIDWVETCLSKKPLTFENLIYSEQSINSADYLVLRNYYSKKEFINNKEGLVLFHADKNEVELNSMRASFDKADKAIFKTIQYIKEQIQNDKTLSELDFYHICNEFYEEEGAFDQSFNTISGFGKNSSIIHFGSPSKDVLMTKNEFALLDSGAYFESGYATDTTRTFLTGGTASSKHKEIYTLVLKGLLNALNSVFPVGTIGAQIDAITRAPLFLKGYNYNHGTGHGVGINVHEGGFRIGPQSTMPLIENRVGSIEPGIYLPGFGGVRLENIVIVKKHSDYPGFLCFESLVYVGFDHELIETSMLSQQEMMWLDHYERECAKRGRSFKYTK